MGQNWLGIMTHSRYLTFKTGGILTIWPVFVTATCDSAASMTPNAFRQANGSYSMGREEGSPFSRPHGSTFAETNNRCWSIFINQVFEKNFGSYMKMGDLLMAAKIRMGKHSQHSLHLYYSGSALANGYPDLKRGHHLH